MPCAEKVVRLVLDDDAFKFWDAGAHAWTIAHGSYRVILGRSSREFTWQELFTPAPYEL